MIAGIILAGGRSERMVGYDRPKQFVEVGGKMIISYCLETFAKCPAINMICLVSDEKWRSHIGDYLFADSGISRQHSVWNGLLALKAYSPEYIVIHDSARPCVTVDNITEYIDASLECDGAMPALAVTETIYRSTDGKKIASTLNRDEFFVGQTPECFKFEPYFLAHRKYSNILDSFRGSSEIAVKAGMEITLVKGNPDNFKITTNSDLERFRYIMRVKQS